MSINIHGIVNFIYKIKSVIIFRSERNYYWTGIGAYYIIFWLNFYRNQEKYGEKTKSPL